MNLNPLGHVLGNLIVCGLIQVTLVAFVATIASQLFHWKRNSSMPLLKAALTAIVLLTFAVLVPIPSWLQTRSIGRSTTSAPPTSTSSLVDQDGVELVTEPEDKAGNTTSAFGLRDAFIAGFEGLRNLNQETNTRDTDSATTISAVSFSGSTVCLTVFCAGALIGLVRLIGGLIGVRFLVHNSRPLGNSRLLELVDQLAAKTRCVQTLSIRESNLVMTAATVGWWRPVILLSHDWQSWSDDQLRSVLAHELAHIARGDFLTTVLAQLGLVLHFYHPMVHWLVGRMRLEQELAADAIAAEAVGDPRIYLRAIGELALAQSSEQLSWPAHTFLPTRKTFLRRIEMLRDMNLLSGTVPYMQNACSICVMIGVALVAVGIRPMSAIAVTPLDPQVEPKQAGLSPTPASSDSVEAHFVPADAAAVAVIRTQEILPTLEKSLQAAGPMSKDDSLKALLQSLKKSTQMTIVMGPLDHATKEPFACAIEFADTVSRDGAIAQLLPMSQAAKETYLHYEYERFGNNAKYLPDSKTLVIGEVETVKRLMLAGRQSASVLTQSKSWQEATKASIALKLDVTVLREVLKNAPSSPIIGVFSPLWKQAKSHLLTISLNNQAGISITSTSENPEAVEPIATSLNAGVGLLKSYVQSNSKLPPFSNNADNLQKLFDTKSLSKSSDSVTLSLSADAEVLSNLSTGVLMPAITASRLAAQRSQMTNQLKQVMLALHNYADAHGHFPPAVIIDKKSGVARSWRVELLPYIDGYGPLYEQYQKDQPWDSPANKGILEKMPILYRRPGDTTNNTSVFAAYGKGLFFEVDDPVGTKLPEITDGTSNTVAIVEGNKEVPWTKPEELAIDIEKGELPPFGATNGEILLAGFGDGSVRAVAKSIDPKVLIAIFTRAGGELIGN